jgi:site-specific recombinase XerD
VSQPARKPRIPSYRLHKSSGQAIISIRGRMFYLGEFNSPKSRSEYGRLIAEWSANDYGSPPGRPPDVPSSQLTCDELAAAYWTYAEGYYVKDGGPTSEVDSIRQALKPVRRLYGHKTAKDFGPLALRAVRDAMITQGKDGWSRTYVNRQINRVKRMFRWAVSHQLLPESVYAALCTVEGLRRGRTQARETSRVAPVPDAVIEATIRHLRPTVAAMVSIQRCTGTRPQEIVGMMASDIDRQSDPACWIYRPRRHKTSHLEKERVVFLGPRAQEILKPYLISGHTGFVFSPERSEAARNAEKRLNRMTPLWRSHAERRAKSSAVHRKRPPRDRYDVASYRRAIRRACNRAFPHPTLNGIKAKELNDDQRAALHAWQKSHRWHPHQLRHSSATAVRQSHGLEAAQVHLGHSEADTTGIYAERDMALARRVAIEIG